MLRPTWISSLDSVNEAEWGRLAADETPPFMEWPWLSALERSGAASPEQGWHPAHLLYSDDDDGLVAAFPAYIKNHSMGEFVFDQGLADASIRAGIRYYPKLVAMSPFTPAPVYSPLLKSGAKLPLHEVITEMRSFSEKNSLGGFSFLYPARRFEEELRKHRLIEWVHHLFLWENPGYTTFSDYLQSFKRTQRNNIRREIESTGEERISFRWLEGSDITPGIIDLMYEYYRNTNRQYGPWAAFYLTRSFFADIRARFSHRLLLLGAYRPEDEEPLALSFFLKKGERLYGRYWGAREFVKNLYFVICYYEPIRYCIETKLRYFDPGMGSYLKVRRGFSSYTVGSYHEFRDPRLDAFFRSYIKEVNRDEQDYSRELNARIPVKGSDRSG